eukprot:TRINITY_DN100838_c0_g1_i1.p1 TRINITY_DN100838_c0_g1~~TRINITY_DN100838_c0_g1_i1.p1  ORF type:complete len:341 (+),score=22.96 TRINITY_DN100838_c0_g1_i1:82-1104(+)
MQCHVFVRLARPQSPELMQDHPRGAAATSPRARRRVLLVTALIVLASFSDLMTSSFSAPPAVRPPCDTERHGQVDEAGMKLLRWLSRWHASVHDCIETRLVPSKGRCLFASRPIPNGTILIKVPPGLMVPALDDHEISLKLSSHFADDLALEARSCLAILRVRRDPEWSPYVCVWPEVSELSSLPFFWDDERLQEAAKTMPQLQSRVQERRLFVAKAARLLDVDEREFAYAHAVSCTRAIGGANSCCTCVPGVDFANHDPLANNTRIMRVGTIGIRDGWSMVSESGDVWEYGSAALVATRNITAGEEICITYGPLSDEELLFEFGFTLGEDNPHRKSETV